MQSYFVCAELGAVLGAGIHAMMGTFSGAGSSLWTGWGWSGILTGLMRSQVPGSSVFVIPTVSGAAGSSHLVSIAPQSCLRMGSAEHE